MDGSKFQRFIGHDPNGSAFEMVNGLMFDPMDPDPCLMTIDTLATVLSNSCRFGGHVKKFLSTAQHSVLVAALAPNDCSIQRYALLHDGDEAWGLPDMITPVKAHFPEFREAQNRIGTAVEVAFELDHAMHDAIKIADRQALFIERCAVKDVRNIDTWRQWLGNAPEPAGILLNPMLPEEARWLFMEAYDEVFVHGRAINLEWLAERNGCEIQMQGAKELVPC